MARGKTLQGERTTTPDLATFMNDRSAFYGTVSVPAGAKILLEVKGHKIISEKLIDTNGNPLQWNIQAAQQSQASAG